MLRSIKRPFGFINEVEDEVEDKVLELFVTFVTTLSFKDVEEELLVTFVTTLSLKDAENKVLELLVTFVTTLSLKDVEEEDFVFKSISFRY